MQACKYASMQVCKYAGMQVFKCINRNVKCMYETGKYVSIEKGNYGIMQQCEFASMLVSTIGIEVF